MIKTYNYLVVILSFLLVACNNEMIVPQEVPIANPVELAGIRVSIDNGHGATTRAASTPTGTMPSALEDSIGRWEFDDHDKLVFTKIQRTDHALSEYSYNNVIFNHTSSAWNIQENQQTTKIYWSDGSSTHTFVGYCLPHKTTEEATTENFDWVKVDNSTAVYYGSIGNPSVDSEVIDYNVIEGGLPQNLRKEDLLLTYDDGIKNLEGEPIANIVCHHALASVRVLVTITGFSNSATDPDSKSTVSELVLDDQPVMYKWTQGSYAVEGRVEADNNLSGLTGSWNQKKNMKLWQPHPAGTGSGSGRLFTFYGINVPGQYDVPISFKVTYPDPLNPTDDSKKLTKTYKAKLEGVSFCSGYCTSITINLNHQNEEITIGAEYIEWDNIDTPDEGDLLKNETFLSDVKRANVTLMGDAKATADDATWLYVESNGTIKDIYGHTGTSTDPFQISTANQLLSFAYEVKGNQSRATSVTVKIDPTGAGTTTISTNDAFDFSNYYIKLDAGLTLQSSTEKDSVRINWPGIGDSEHAFNGTFLGGGRYISRMKSNSFFLNIGEKALVDQLVLDNVIDIGSDKGAIADKNAGCITASKVEGNVISTSTSPVGGLVGENSGLLFACYHIGNVSGQGAKAGGLVGTNSGSNAAIVACYNQGDIKPAAGGVLAEVNNAPSSVYGCYYDNTKTTASIVAPAESIHSGFTSNGVPTSQITKPSFVGDKASPAENTLNGVIKKWTEEETYIPERFRALREQLRNHYYESYAASYPRVF